MKILQLLHQRDGDIQTHVEALSVALTEFGHSVTIHFEESKDDWLSQCRSRARLKSLFKSADIIHAHGFRTAYLTSRLARNPWVYTAHTAGIPKPLSLVEALNAACQGIAVSHSLCEELCAAGIDNIVINAGGLIIDSNVPTKQESRAALKYEMDDKVVGCFGKLSHDRAVDDLLDAMQEVWYEHEDAQLLVCGDGPEREDLLGTVEGLMRRENVRFLPYHPKRTALIAACDLVVSPCRVEALGLDAIEAMSIGVPVVARRIGGLAEVVEDGVTGKLVDPDKPMSDAIIDLLFAPTLMRAMGDAGKLRANERFDMRKNATEVAKSYEKCA